MHARNRIEPALAKPSAPRRIAVFFWLVSLVGSVPAGLGVFLYGCYGLMGLEIAAEAFGRARSILDGFWVFAGMSVYVAGAALIWLGFRQMAFYLRRATSPFVPNARRWWLSTYLYNLVGLGVSLVLVYQDGHIGSFISALWFGLLCALAIRAYAAERPENRLALPREAPHV